MTQLSTAELFVKFDLPHADLLAAIEEADYHVSHPMSQPPTHHPLRGWMRGLQDDGQALVD